MSDYISRQDAIEAIYTWDMFGVDERGRLVRWHEGLEPYVHLRDVLTSIVNLPSAQPEIIHCRDCKHRGEKPIADGRYWCEIHDTFMYYCSDAERRTDEWMGNS